VTDTNTAANATAPTMPALSHTDCHAWRRADVSLILEPFLGAVVERNIEFYHSYPNQ
jgi:hypothetical protein